MDLLVVPTHLATQALSDPGNRLNHLMEFPSWFGPYPAGILHEKTPRFLCVYIFIPSVLETIQFEETWLGLMAKSGHQGGHSDQNIDGEQFFCPEGQV